MDPLPNSATDADLLEFIDGWAALMEREDYESAYAYTDHVPEMGWTPALMRDVVKSYGDGRADQKITVTGVPSDIAQEKTVDRWGENREHEVGEIWYDLNIDGIASDLTATFRIIQAPDGLKVRLNDIHVM